MGDRPNERKAVRTPRFTFDGVSLLCAAGSVAVAYWYGDDPSVHRVWALIGLGVVMGVLCGLRWYWGPPNPHARRLSRGVVSGAAFLAAALLVAFANPSVQVVAIAGCAGGLIVRAFQPPWANPEDSD